MYKIVETIYDFGKYNSEGKRQFKSYFNIHFKTFWGWRILTRKEIREDEIIFQSYEEAEDYLKKQLGYSDNLIKDGNVYKFNIACFY